MTDSKDKDQNNEPSQGMARKPLTLNRNLGSGTVRQSFSHGRSKAVVVEIKKKRGLELPKPPAFDAAKTIAPSKPAAVASTPQPQSTSTQNARGLSDSELKARQDALERAREAEIQRQERDKREADARRAREELDRIRAEEQERLNALDKRQDQSEANEAELESENAPVKPFQTESQNSVETETAQTSEEPSEYSEDDSMLSELGGRVKKQKQQVLKIIPVARTKNAPQRRSGRLSITAALEDGDRQRSLASVRRAREKERERRLGSMRQESSKQSRDVTIPEAISVADLANRMAERLTDVVKYLMKQGQMLKGTDVLDADTAELIVADFGHNPIRVAESDVEIGLEGEKDIETNLEPRPPVVTIMGHVDHGKTSLLDAIRQADVVSGEAGGITQHIGAYQVRLPTGEKVTFLDTPGHAAFSAMRSRGAKVTDIVILVVAADDGVMPQTIEAINHAKAAGVPIIVAVNKIDKEGANSQKVLNELLQHEVITEAVGGDTLYVEVSALKKLNLDKLLETIMLQAEVLELKANPNRSAEGFVIEAKLDKGRGFVSTVLVQRGTMKRGDIVVAGSQWGRVKAMSDERGQSLEEAGPAQPVEVLGLDGAPEPGDQLVVVENEARAREVVNYRIRMRRDKSVIRSSARTGLENMLARIKDQKIKEFPFIVKADVQGSAEAITASVVKLANEEVVGRVIHQGVGGITESDVSLAKSTGGVVLAFNTRANKQVRDLADAEGVEIRYYSIIYNLLDDVKDILSGMLEPERRETFIGYAKILQVFNITKVGKIAGCMVTEGTIKRGCGVRLLRDEVVIHEGKLSTLKRFKDEVSEVQNSQECGMGFEDYQDLREGDQIECFEVEIIKRSL